jgi:ectoine hydroxylase-related dioxygenase (phytanoyl-CoA dioxygenase family)
MLNEEQIKEFNEQGFIIIKGLFNQEEITKIKNSFEFLYTKAMNLNGVSQMLENSEFVFEPGGLNRIVWCGGNDQHLLEIGASEKILKPVSQLLESQKMIQLINQAHFKMPGEKVEFFWHQDSEHRRYGTDMWKDVNGKGSYIQTALAIDPMTNENGPLKFYPKSNQLGYLNIPENKNWKEQLPHKEEFVVNLAPGDLALFGPYAIHSSSVNNSDKPRRILINGYAYPGANSKEYPGVGLGRELNI